MLLFFVISISMFCLEIPGPESSLLVLLFLATGRRGQPSDWNCQALNSARIIHDAGAVPTWVDIFMYVFFIKKYTNLFRSWSFCFYLNNMQELIGFSFQRIYLCNDNLCHYIFYDGEFFIEILKYLWECDENISLYLGYNSDYL